MALHPPSELRRESAKLLEKSPLYCIPAAFNDFHAALPAILRENESGADCEATELSRAAYFRRGAVRDHREDGHSYVLTFQLVKAAHNRCCVPNTILTAAAVAENPFHSIDHFERVRKSPKRSKMNDFRTFPEVHDTFTPTSSCVRRAPSCS